MSGSNSRSGYLGSQVAKRLDVDGRDNITPPLPEKIGIEINNSCNHKCYFCPNPTMTRARSVMDDTMVFRVTKEAYDAGIRQISFYSGGEPFLNKGLAKYVSYAKEIGFDYVYLSTNGGKVVTPRLESVLHAGLDSLKFSVNAGNRETYKLVHGHDEFDEVVKNIKFVSEYRQSYRPEMKLFVSFVETPLSKDSFDSLRSLVSEIVDEVVVYPFVVIGTPLQERIESDGTPRPYIGYDETNRREDWNAKRLRLPCYQLWSYLNVTMEGYLSACCSDYNNDLVVGNLHQNTLLEAWHSKEFQALRMQHIERNIKGTLCDGCIAQKDRPYNPINMHLRNHDRKVPGRIAPAAE